MKKMKVWSTVLATGVALTTLAVALEVQILRLLLHLKKKLIKVKN
ncbi:Uncharacterised protein [Streptococcus pneumoniae]|nr:Uncharacterised protein [Streptococcus pneumoniae]VLE45950.1 Uncharacterised protein [Streptococcus pneumoniae]VNJ90980.1 Uncharacterised protein [Streptococcus pneumoniae]